MNLKKIALRRCKEKMEAWDPTTETFIPNSFLARIDLTDRFLSNFNKPTRRRMLFADNEVVFPESRVCRHPGTKDVYLLGTTRQDARDGNPYLGLTILQLVTDEPGGTAGLATITRKVVQGPPSDPGWLVDTVFARSYVDTEFLTSTDEVATTDMRIERYNAYLPLPVQPQEWDFLTLHGVKHRVLDTFADSGFFALRIDHEEDYRTNFVLHMNKRERNKVTQEYDVTERSYNVTGVMEKAVYVALWATDSETSNTVYFEKEHLPADLEWAPDTYQLELNGVRRTVKTMETQPGNRQVLMRLK